MLRRSCKASNEMKTTRRTSRPPHAASISYVCSSLCVFFQSLKAAQAAHSMEHTTEGGQTHTRHNMDANITQQDLIDSYLAPFQVCVEQGKVSGLMCSCESARRVWRPSVRLANGRAAWPGR